MVGVLVMCILFLTINLGLAVNYEVIPERAEFTNINKKYISNATVFIRRTGRKSPYYINVEATTLFWAGHNFIVRKVNSVFFEYLHNEYKRSFVEINLSLCDIINKEPWRTLVGVSLEAKGVRCPSPPGTYKLNNLTVFMLNFPYVWPFEKAMLEGYVKLATTQEILARGRFYFTFKRNVPKRK